MSISLPVFLRWSVIPVAGRMVTGYLSLSGMSHPTYNWRKHLGQDINRPQPPRNVRRHMVRWKLPCAIQPSCGTSPASSVGGYLTGSVLSLEVSHPQYHPAVTLYMTLRIRRSDKQACSALCSRTIIILTTSRSPEGPKTGEHDDPCATVRLMRV